MKFIKSEDGEKVFAVNDHGEVIAFIEKDRFGTHGHWRGWKHFKYCYYTNSLVWCGVFCGVIFPSWKSGYGIFDKWTSDPSGFANIKEFKEHYTKEVSV